MSPTKAPQLLQVRRHTEESSGNRGLGMELQWGSGEKHFLRSSFLRKSCPCASCQQLRGDSSHEKPLSGAAGGRSLLKVISSTLGESEDLVQIRPVGNYAVNLLWGDKHDSGIFTYDFLYQLSQEPSNA